MPRRNAFEKRYVRLAEVLARPPAELTFDRAYRYRASGFMDLVVERLPCREADTVVLSLAHYFEQNGDLCQDPEMTVRIVLPADGRPGMVEALTFQQAWPPVFVAAYPQPGRVDPAAKQELNGFLDLWLGNLRDQGHQPV